MLLTCLFVVSCGVAVGADLVAEDPFLEEVLRPLQLGDCLAAHPPEDRVKVTLRLTTDESGSPAGLRAVPTIEAERCLEENYLSSGVRAPVSVATTFLIPLEVTPRTTGPMEMRVRALSLAFDERHRGEQGDNLNTAFRAEVVDPAVAEFGPAVRDTLSGFAKERGLEVPAE